MQIVYLDVLAALNFGMDYGILRAAGRLSGRDSTFLRLTAASGAGAVYASMCLLFPALACIPLRLAAAAVMTGAAFDCPSRASRIRMTLTVWLVSMVFGGGVCAVSAMCDGDFYRNGVLTVQVPRGVLIFAALISYFISGLVFRREASADAPERESVEISADGRTARVLLMRDSGNKLTDPYIGLPVLILTRQTARTLFPTAERQAHERQIPFCALSGEGIMDSFVPDEIRREDGTRYRAVAAITDSTFGADCDGLIADTADERRSYEKVLECSLRKDKKRADTSGNPSGRQRSILHRRDCGSAAAVVSGRGKKGDRGLPKRRRGVPQQTDRAQSASGGIHRKKI